MVDRERRKRGCIPNLENRERELLGGMMASNSIVEVNDSNFDQDVLKSDKPVLIDFWAAWCGPCRALAPIVDELATAYEGKVKVAKMDVDRNSATPMRYGVRGIPTLLVFKGGQVKEQIVGYVPKEQIQKALDKHIG
jgi:thioredoxin